MMIAIAKVLSTRATCIKREVGCVFVDEENRIIGTGYNGVPRGVMHCTEEPCPGADAPRGSDSCLAVHAEQNALINCKTPNQIDTCFVTCMPCLRCTKMLLNTSCKTIVTNDMSEAEELAVKLWTSVGRHLHLIA